MKIKVLKAITTLLTLIFFVVNLCSLYLFLIPHNGHFPILIICSFLMLVSLFVLTYLLRGNKEFFLLFTCVMVVSVILFFIDLGDSVSTVLNLVLKALPLAYIMPVIHLRNYFLRNCDDTLLITLYYVITYLIFLIIWFSGKFDYKKLFDKRKETNLLKK